MGLSCRLDEAFDTSARGERSVLLERDSSVLDVRLSVFELELPVELPDTELSTELSLGVATADNMGGIDSPALLILG